jgi:hypothetical protein
VIVCLRLSVGARPAGEDVMKTRSLLSSMLLASLLVSGGAKAAAADPCVSSPEPPPVDSNSGQSAAGPGLADPGPCKITTSAKKSKGGKGSNNGKGPGNGQGSNNGNGNAGGNGNGGGQEDNSEESKVKQGFAIAPVDLNLQGRNRALVGLGSYIVNAQGGCVDCHTSPTYVAGGDPYQGQPKMINKVAYLAGGKAFGAVKSANLTPDPANSLTEEQRYADFVKSMRTGVKSTGGYLQVMPWPVYQDMTDRDLEAIFEYLQAIPYAKTP